MCTKRKRGLHWLVGMLCTTAAMGLACPMGQVACAANSHGTPATSTSTSTSTSTATATATAKSNASLTPVAHRVITLAPHITEMVYAAGAGRDIVGTVTSSNYPPRAEHIPRVGNGIQISLERIVALRPTLIIAWQPAGAARIVAPLAKRLHIPIIYIAPKTLNDIPHDIVWLGMRLGTEKQAENEAKKLSDRIRALTARYAQRKPVSTFIEVGATPLYTLGGDPLTNDALRICGGVNIFAGAPIPAPQVSAESVLAKQPDAIIIPTVDGVHLAARTAYWVELHLPAALAHHVYGIDPDTLFRPGPRLVDATAALCKDLDHAR